MRHRVPEDRSDHEGHDTAHGEEDHRGAHRGPGAERRAGGDHRQGGAQPDEHRLVERLPLGNAVIELQLHGAEGDQQARGGGVPERGAPARVPGPAACLAEQQPGGHRREHRRPDHEQVGRTPHGHVDAVVGVPEVVEREAGDAAGADHEQTHAAPGKAQPPQRPGGGGAVEGGHRDAHRPGGAEAGEADEDEDVGGGEQLGVAAEVDVPGDIPEESEAGAEQGPAVEEDAAGAPAREPGDPLQRGRGALQPGERPGAPRWRAGGDEPPGDGDEQADHADHPQPLGRGGVPDRLGGERRGHDGVPPGQPRFTMSWYDVTYFVSRSTVTMGSR